jgi:hypothetical protein
MNKECFGSFEHCPIEIPDGLDENWDALFWRIDCPDKFECYKHMSNIYQQPILYLGDGSDNTR